MDENMIRIEKRLHELEMKEADQGKLLHELLARLELVENHEENTRRFGEAIRETIRMMEEAE